MFEFLFKYPSSVFSKGTFVFLAGLPVWLLVLAVILVAAGLAYLVRSRANGSKRVNGVRGAVVWLLQAVLASVLLLLLWHPALSVATLRPQQNIVAVVVDDSASMAIQDGSGGQTRSAEAQRVLNSGLIKSLQQKFQVRYYRLSDRLAGIEKLDQLTGAGQATHIGDSLKEVLADAQSLPIGAVVLASDGSDNSGGIDLETIGEIRRQRNSNH